jgi:hypothetical protein
MSEVRIWTSNAALAQELEGVELGGIEVARGAETSRKGQGFTDVVLRLTPEVPINLFASWLFDLLKSHRKGETEIGGFEMPADDEELHALILKLVHKPQNADRV